MWIMDPTSICQFAVPEVHRLLAFHTAITSQHLIKSRVAVHIKRLFIQMTTVKAC